MTAERIAALRKLLERIEYMTGSGTPIGPDRRSKINDLAREALALLTLTNSTPAE